MVSIEDVDPIILAKSNLSLEIKEETNNHFVFSLLIWDNPQDPLRLPFIFNLSDMVHRYQASALCEQPVIPLYFLHTDSNERIIVSFCRELSWPTHIRAELRKTIIQAFVSNDSKEESETIKGSDLSFEEMMANGWAYQFDQHKLIQKYGSEGSNDVIIQNIFECAKRLANYKNQGINEGPFLFWLLRKEDIFGTSGSLGEGVVLFITPFYSERAKRARTEHEPCYDYLSKCYGFMRLESGNPIFENAIPMYKFISGATHRNIYRYLLDEAQAK